MTTSATLTSAPRLAQARLPAHKPIAFLCAVALIACQFPLIEQHVASVPLRVAAFCLGAIYIATQGFLGSDFLRSRSVGRVIFAWAIFCTLLLITQTANGTVQRPNDLYDFVSRFGYAIVSFIVIGIASQRDARLMATLMFAIALGNLIFAVLQASGVQWAWSVHDALFPLTDQREDELISQGLNRSFGYIPGLSAYSIVTGYVFTVFGLLAIAASGAPSRRLSQYLPTIAMFAIVIAGALLIYSRSTLLIGVVVASTMAWHLSRGIERFLWLSLFALGGLLAVTIFVQLTTGLTDILPGVGRMLSLSDPQRVGLVENSARAFLTSPLVGIGPQAREEFGVAIGAHNAIINALLTSGIIGFAAMIYLTWVTLTQGWRIVRQTTANAKVLAASAFASLCAYLLKSLVHNESLVTSGIMYFMVLGLLLGGGLPYVLRQRK